uniref:Uncharacterized protein n=1 Tax=Aegilops tauschii subsp. strangulata TaxID=200361 RepID=A0A453EW18_AEGTS
VEARRYNRVKEKRKRLHVLIAPNSGFNCCKFLEPIWNFLFQCITSETNRDTKNVD